ncbi:unnamed protein product [Closterium sp. NIES-65]|nr:unnamed protein product [Closterium sp. NIES-65]
MRRRLKCVHWGPDSSSSNKSELRAETPSASQESGQQRSAARRSPGPDEGCETGPSPPARADICAASARAEEPPGQGPSRGEDRWSPQCVRDSPPHSPAPAAPLPQTHSWPDRGQDLARDHYRHAHRHSAGPFGLRNQPSADAGGTARGDPNPSDAQATPSPASPEIAAESVARGIALGVSASLSDHEGIGGEESDGPRGTDDRQLRPGDHRDTLENGGEEIAAAAADVAANARAPDAADQWAGSRQPEQEPTSTPARGAGEPVEEEEIARARSGGRAHLRRGAQRHADDER